MGVVANAKQSAGSVSNSLTPIPTIASATALPIPDEGTVFYVTGTTAITSFTGSIRPGRRITLIWGDSATADITVTSAAVPGAVGLIYGPSLTSLTVASCAVFVQNEVGAWFCEGTTVAI